MDRQLRIGNIQLENPFLLAPMAGFTDNTMRRICSGYGASLVFTEMVSAKGLYYGDKKTERLLKITEDEKPTAIQIFGSEPEIMAFAADNLKDRENAILDINMGCPVPKIVKNGDGSAMLKKPDLIYDVVSAVTKAAAKPVTVKIRTGFTQDDFLGMEAAKAIEAAGAAAVVVHGRTREQYYEGKADLEKIGEIKAALRIPVIGNGDIEDYQSAMNMMKVTGCDMVMVGRAAIGKPWIFKELSLMWQGNPKPEEPTIEEIKELMIRHYTLLEQDKGEYAAVREMRKFIGKYVKGRQGSAAFRGQVNTITEGKRLIEAIQGL